LAYHRRVRSFDNPKQKLKLLKLNSAWHVWSFRT